MLFTTNCDMHDHDNGNKHRRANDTRNGRNIDTSFDRKENNGHQHEESHDRNRLTNDSNCDGSNSNTYKHDNGDLANNT